MNFATLDLNLLRVLDAIFREGSTVKAGQALGLSQSAVSGALSRLRHHLDDPLFVRQGNRLVATAFADALRHDLRDELERIETLLTRPTAFDPAQATGTFKIAAADFFADMLMPQLGRLLNQQAPNLRAQLVELYPHDYAQSIDRLNADIALMPAKPLPDWLIEAPLFKSVYAVIARSGHPATRHVIPGGIMPFDVFCTQSHVLFSPEGHFSAQGDTALERVGRRRHVAMTVPTFAGVCRVVSESDLIALLPGQLARRIQGSYGLDLFQSPMRVPPIQLIAAWHRKTDQAPQSVWMRDRIFDILRPLDDTP